jgi:hypothetical protein
MIGHINFMMSFLLRSSVRISRDAVRTVISFTFDSTEYLAIGSLDGTITILHTDFSFSPQAKLTIPGPVTSLAIHPPTAFLPEGGLLVGSRNRTITLWPLRAVVSGTATAPCYAPPQFAKDVCFVGAAPDGSSFVGSDWNSIARVFTADRETAVLRHEEYAIWSVAFGPTFFVTAGGDGSLRKFSLSGDLIVKRTGAHSAAARVVVRLPAAGPLISVGNDGFLVEWDDNLDEIRRTRVASEGLYSFAILDAAAGRYAVAGNNKAVFVVDNGAVTDVFPIGRDVWGLAQLECGDVVAGVDDGFLYALTRDPARRAFDLLEDGFFARLAAPVLTVPGTDDIALVDLPEFGSAPPRITADPTLFRRGDAKVLAAWFPAYGRWAVVATVKPSERPADARGERWDIIVDVLLEGDNPKKLCLNRGENEYIVARRFIFEYGLPAHHLEPIAGFLRSSVGSGAYSSLKPVFGSAPAAVARADDVQRIQAAIARGQIAEVAEDLRAVVLAENVRDLLPRASIGRVVRPFLANPVDFLSVLADHFLNYGDTFVNDLVGANVLGRINEVDPGKQAEFARFVLNFTVYANGKPNALEYIADHLEKAFRLVDGFEEKQVVIRAIDVAATYAPVALAKLKQFVSTLQGSPDAGRFDSRPIAHVVELSAQ